MHTETQSPYLPKYKRKIFSKMWHHLIITHKILLCTGTVLQIGIVKGGGQETILHPELPCIQAHTVVFI